MAEETTRNNKGQFVKGVSGNPGGPWKTWENHQKIKDVKALARQHTDRAIERLAELMEDPDGGVAARACEALLDRGWGKPKQSVDIATQDEAQTQAMRANVAKLLQDKGAQTALRLLAESLALPPEGSGEL